jgi:hypothetical protein
MWAERGNVSCREFDECRAAMTGQTPSAIRSLRSRLGLTTKTVSIPTGPGVDYKVIYDAILQEERDKLTAKTQTGFRSLIQDHAKREWIRDVVKTGVAQLSPPSRPSFTPVNSRETEHVCVLLSDMHFGSKTGSEFLGGLSAYDKDIFARRITQLTARIDSLVRDRQKICNVEYVRFLVLGDIVDGEAIFGGQAGELDVTVRNQVLHGAQAISGLVSHVASLVPKVTVDFVPGNHGRLSKEAPVGDNWENFLGELVKWQLNTHDNILVSPNNAFFRCVDIMGYSFLLLHGHQIRSVNKTALERFVARQCAMHRTHFDYICMGHHHVLKIEDVNGTEVMINPALVSSSNFAVGELSLCSKPGQLAFGVTKEGAVWKHKVCLE